MGKITFDDIHTFGTVVFENEHYRQFHFPEMLVYYDSNFIDFKTMPNVEEFEEAERHLMDYHLKHGQNHLKFYFPENGKLSKELTNHLTKNGYDLGFMELYAIQPEQFPTLNIDEDIKIETVTRDTINSLLALQYKQDLEFGRNFADQKAHLIKKQVDVPTFQQVLASYKGEPAGYVNVIVSEDTAEIDNLTVDEAYRNKGIARRLQRFVMDSFPTKTVILVADGEDTPREMYKKQNYQNLGFQYEALKVNEQK